MALREGGGGCCHHNVAITAVYLYSPTSDTEDLSYPTREKERVTRTCPSWQASHLESTWMIASGSNGSMVVVTAAFPLPPDVPDMPACMGSTGAKDTRGVNHFSPELCSSSGCLCCSLSNQSTSAHFKSCIPSFSRTFFAGLSSFSSLRSGNQNEFIKTHRRQPFYVSRSPYASAYVDIPSCRAPSEHERSSPLRKTENSGS